MPTYRRTAKDIIEIFGAENSQYWFRWKAPNGKILMHSEMYESRDSARSAIKGMQKRIPGLKSGVIVKEFA